MKRKDAYNLISLTSIQASNAFLPLFVFPYSLKYLGPELYSKVAVSESIMFVCLALVLYSFEIDGVTDVVGLDFKSDREKISQVFSGIFFTRLCLFFGCLVLALPLYLFLDEQVFMLVFVWMLVPLSHIFQATFLFQGMERNAPLALISVVTRFLCAWLIVCLVQEQSDYLLVPLIIGSCYVLGGVVAMGYVLRYFHLTLNRVPISIIKRNLMRGKEIFVGNMSVMLFRDFNLIILSYFTSNTVVISSYSITEKIIKSIQATMRPLNKLFFPKVIYALRNEYAPSKKSFVLVGKSTAPQLIILVTGLLAFSFFYVKFARYSPYFCQYPNIDRIEVLILLMISAVFFGICNFMYGTVGLNNLNARAYYAKSILFVGVISLFVCMLSTSFLTDKGAALSFVFGEILLFIFVAIKYRQSDTTIDV